MSMGYRRTLAIRNQTKSTAVVSTQCESAMSCDETAGTELVGQWQANILKTQNVDSWCTERNRKHTCKTKRKKDEQTKNHNKQEKPEFGGHATRVYERATLQYQEICKAVVSMGIPMGMSTIMGMVWGIKFNPHG